MKIKYKQGNLKDDQFVIVWNGLYLQPIDTATFAI